MFLEKNTQTTHFLQYQSFKTAMVGSNYASKVKWMVGIGLIILITLFLPWTQNIRTKGNVSTLDPQQRPQQVNTMIPGRIAKWYVRDGAMVKKGDTLLQITETKDEYLDPELTKRTSEQLKAKNDATEFYKSKVTAADKQMAALQLSLELKIGQLKNKLKQYRLQIQSDSIAMLAAARQFSIADVQLKRQSELYNAGLKSLTEFEQRQ